LNKFFLVILLSVGAISVASAEAFVSFSGALTLPQGGSRLRRVGGAALKGGWYLNENWALEGEAAWLEDYAGLSADALWHWQGAELYSKFFGFSPFDPFFTVGARGWVGRDPGQIGPKAGFGAFYHLTDNWSVRGDADATLGLDTEVEMAYTLSLGLQYSF